MKAVIRDETTLATLVPVDTAAYLRTNGWREVEHQDLRRAVWVKSLGEEHFEILLPLDRTFRDYDLRTAELLATLELVEQRSRQDILRDISTTFADVIRIRTQQESAKNGSVSLVGGVSLVENARDLLLAAACATLSKRPYFPTRKPDAAIHYVEKLRMGQTEQGSYVMTIQSPVPPALQGALFSEKELPESTDPFERRVVKTLMRATALLREAADESAATGDIKPFREAVPLGVSANLCDALVGLQEGTDSDWLEVGVRWAPARRMVEETIRSCVRIPREVIPVLREAGRVFKQTISFEDVMLRGFVTDLHRTDSRAGPITVSAVVEDQFRKVRIDLNPPDYDLAITAHRDRLPVTCEGDLVREGKGYVLKNPRNFSVQREED
jgi:hypothetical protein